MGASETERELKDIATRDGGSVRDTLDSRYDDIKSGKVKPIPGDEAFARLHARIGNRLIPDSDN